MAYRFSRICYQTKIPGVALPVFQTPAESCSSWLFVQPSPSESLAANSEVQNSARILPVISLTAFPK